MPDPDDSGIIESGAVGTDVAATDTDSDSADVDSAEGAGPLDSASEPSGSATSDWTPDDAALAAYADLARSALLGITPAETIGEPAGHVVEGDRVVSVHFASVLAGYPGWRWTVSIAQVDGAEPTVLETELTPGDGALLAPDWTPWVDRLADYRAAQDVAAREAADAEAADVAAAENDEASSDDHELDDDLDDDDDDDDDDDSDDEDDEVGRVRALLHSGDLDGVDIDDLDESDDDDDDEPGDDEESAEDERPEGADSARVDVSGSDRSGAPADPVRVEQSEQPEQDSDATGDEHPAPAATDDRPDEDQ